MPYITNAPFLQATDMVPGSIIPSAIPNRKRWQRASDGRVFAIDATNGVEYWNDPSHDGNMEAAIVTEDGFMVWDCTVAPARIYRVIG